MNEPMDLHVWLDAEAGRSTWLAEQMGRSKGAVSLWRIHGVPLSLMPRVEELTGGAVTVQKMAEHAIQCRLKDRTATEQAA